MAEFTENLNLEMPDKTEQYNVAVQNSNMKKIDDFSKLIPPRALTADKLTTGVKINDVFFDGTKDIILENKQQIANCILEIPQRIKLELADGVLTLKAGSVVTVPNGFEADGTTPKFDYVTIESDVSATHSANVGLSYVYYTISSESIGFSLPEQTKSGESLNDNTAIFYNTSTNKVNYIVDGVVQDTRSFPIGLIQRTGVISSIDQVFNGMGYMGTTVLVDKGLRVLIPNGLNKDGTLNNIDFILENNAQWVEIFTDEQTCLLSINEKGKLQAYLRFFSQETNPQLQHCLWYKPSENKTYANHGDGYVEVKEVIIGKYHRKNADSAVVDKVYPFNVTSFAKEQDIDGSWQMKYLELFSGVRPSGDTISTHDLSEYLPDDGNIYEVLIGFIAWAEPNNTSTGCILNIRILTDMFDLYGLAGIGSTGWLPVIRIGGTVTTNQSSSVIVPVAGKEILEIHTSLTNVKNNGTAARLYGYRKVR